MRILVTNDDGIDSVGLHVLARAMQPLGDVVVAAPDQEYSGFGAALGALHLIKPEVKIHHLDGIEEAWSVSGAPALCAMFGRLGVFGPIDLVVAGINPGANVGRSVYHSGTIGACLTARNGGISGVAVSQSVENFGVEGQGWAETLEDQQWQGAADVAAVLVGELIVDLPHQPVVANLNVPNRPAAAMEGWLRTRVGSEPPRSLAQAKIESKPGHEGTFHVEMTWGDAIRIPQSDDGGAVMAGFASLSWLGRLEAIEPDAVAVGRAESALDRLYNAES